MSVLTITLGNTDELQLKVPVKGETNWSDSFKNEFAQKIVEHDHTGVSGKGSKISEAALETDAVTTAKIKDLNVTTAKVADLNVTTAKIADLNVTTAKIANANVTADKIGSDVVISTLNNVSSSAPTSGQVLKWSGSEWAPATDASAAAGTVVLANQTDVNTYTPTPGDVISITATTDLTFSAELNGVVILKGNDESKLTFNNNLFSCVIKTRGDIDFRNLNTDGTELQARQCDIHCKDLEVKNTALNSKIQVYASSIVCLNIQVISLGGDEQANIRSGTTVSCQGLAHIGTFGGNKVLAQGVYITTGTLQGFMRVATNNSQGNVITASRGTGTGSSYEVRVEDSGGTASINGNYPYPFTVNERQISTSVVVRARKTSDQSIPTTPDLITYDTEDIDNTSSFSSSRFTAKVKGFYKVRTGWYMTRSSGYSAYLYLRKNGSDYAQQYYSIVTTSGTGGRYRYTDTIELEVGDYIEIFSDSAVTAEIQHDIDTVFFTIEKIN